MDSENAWTSFVASIRNGVVVVTPTSSVGGPNFAASCHGTEERYTRHHGWALAYTICGAISEYLRRFSRNHNPSRKADESTHHRMTLIVTIKWKNEICLRSSVCPNWVWNEFVLFTCCHVFIVIDARTQVSFEPSECFEAHTKFGWNFTKTSKIVHTSSPWRQTVCCVCVCAYVAVDHNTIELCVPHALTHECRRTRYERFGRSIPNRCRRKRK